LKVFFGCLMLSLWKYAFELASKDLELLHRKKQALDELFSSGRISQPTYEHLSREIGEAITDVEKYLESITCKMKDRMESLEKQMSILEIFLANVEILHATGEIDEETYEKQSKALSIGLESMRNEIKEIKNALEGVARKPAETTVTTCEEKTEPCEASAEEKTAETSSEIV